MNLELKIVGTGVDSMNDDFVETMLSTSTRLSPVFTNTGRVFPLKVMNSKFGRGKDSSC